MRVLGASFIPVNASKSRALPPDQNLECVSYKMPQERHWKYSFKMVMWEKPVSDFKPL